MATFINTLGQTPLAQLPKVPTNFNGTGDTNTIDTSWTNNNTLTGCTNTLQLWSTSLGKWVDNRSYPSSATTGTVTGTTIPQNWNIRVAAKKTSTARYYPSQTKTVASLPPYPVSGMIARWQFEDNLNDSSSNGYNLSINTNFADPIYATGLVGKALGNNATLVELYHNSTTITDLYKAGNAMTLSFWYRTQGDTRNDGIGVISSLPSNVNLIPTNAIQFGSGTGNKNILHVDEAFAASSTYELPSTNVWYHIVVTIDTSNNLIIYVNTTSRITRNSISRPSTNYSYFMTKFGYSSVSQNFDQMYLYNRVLSTAEIAKLYNSGNGI